MELSGIPDRTRLLWSLGLLITHRPQNMTQLPPLDHLVRLFNEYTLYRCTCRQGTIEIAVDDFVLTFGEDEASALLWKLLTTVGVCSERHPFGVRAAA